MDEVRYGNTGFYILREDGFACTVFKVDREEFANVGDLYRRQKIPIVKRGILRGVRVDQLPQRRNIVDFESDLKARVPKIRIDRRQN